MSFQNKREEVILNIIKINNLIRKVKTPQDKLVRLNFIYKEAQTGKYTSCKQVQLAVLNYINILHDKELLQISIKLENFYHAKPYVTKSMYDEPLGKKPKQWQALG